MDTCFTFVRKREKGTNMQLTNIKQIWIIYYAHMLQGKCVWLLHHGTNVHLVVCHVSITLSPEAKITYSRLEEQRSCMYACSCLRMQTWCRKMCICRDIDIALTRLKRLLDCKMNINSTATYFNRYTIIYFIYRYVHFVICKCVWICALFRLKERKNATIFVGIVATCC